MNKIKTSMNDSFFPLPAVLVTAGKKGNWNVMTAAWASKICMEPPHLGVAIRLSRYTHSLIIENSAFALNLPSTDLLEAVDFCGMVSGKEMDKFAKCGLTPLPGPETGAPIIEECPVAFECELVEKVHIGSHDFFAGKVVSRLVDPQVLGDDGKVDYDKLKPIVYLSPYYTSHGDMLGYHGFTKERV